MLPARRGRGRRRGDQAIAAGHHARTPGTGSAVGPSSRASSRNRSSRECRPRSSRTSGRPRSATVSRTMSNGAPPSSAIRTVRSVGPDPARIRRPRTCEARRQRVATLLDLDRQDPGLGGELGHRRRTEEASAVDRHQVVADRLDLAEQVAGQDDRDPELGPGPPDELEHLVATRRVEPVRGLVEEEEPGVVDDRLGQLHPLAHPGGVAADRPVALLREPHVTEDVRRALPGGLRRQAGQLAGLGHELGRADVRRERRMLGHVAHVAPEPGPLRPRHVAHDLDPAAGRRQQAEEDLDERALAGAVGPDQAHDPGRDVERQRVERDDAREPLGQRIDADQRRRGPRGGLKHGPSW